MDELKRFGACGWERLLEVLVNEFRGNRIEVSWGSIGAVSIAQAKEFQAALAEAIKYAESLEAGR